MMITVVSNCISTLAEQLILENVSVLPCKGPFIYYITPKGEGVVTILLYLLYGGGEGV